MKTVTYRGAKDPADKTTRYRIGEYLLPKGAEVEVSDEVAAELAEIDGHDFEIEGAPRKVSKDAEKLATEEGFDLGEIPGTDPIGIGDVRDAIEAKNAAASGTTE